MTAVDLDALDELRGALAEALREAAHVCGWDVPCPCVDWADEQYDATIHATAVSAGHVDEVQGIPEAFADALLPLVGRIAAAKLREAAADVDDGEFSDRWSAAARASILARADALDPP